MNNQQNIFGEIAKKKPTKGKHKEDYYVNLLMWAIQGPIIVHPGGWGDNPPETITSNITMNRLLESMVITKSEEATPMAPEMEAMLYISTASLEAPLDRDWTETYMTLMQRWILNQGKDVPDFLLDIPELNDMQKNDLKRLREWIFKKSFEEVKRKCKEMKKSTLKNPKMEIPTFQRTTKQTDLFSKFG